jgi:hypothetical protein
MNGVRPEPAHVVEAAREGRHPVGGRGRRTVQPGRQLVEGLGHRVEVQVARPDGDFHVDPRRVGLQDVLHGGEGVLK